jgi:hypothetical protein
MHARFLRNRSVTFFLISLHFSCEHSQVGQKRPTDRPWRSLFASKGESVLTENRGGFPTELRGDIGGRWERALARRTEPRNRWLESGLRKHFLN